MKQKSIWAVSLEDRRVEVVAEDKLQEAGITQRFTNDDLESCIDKIRAYIGGIRNGYVH